MADLRQGRIKNGKQAEPGIVTAETQSRREANWGTGPGGLRVENTKLGKRESPEFGTQNRKVAK